MRTVEVGLYSFSELSDEAKEKARDWWREQESQDFDPEYEPYETAATLLGIDFDSRQTGTTRAGKAIYQSAIMYSGFYSQGDGASFTGSWSLAPDCCTAIRKEFPEDTDLHSIADALNAFQCGTILSQGSRNISAKITQNDHHYSHKYTMGAEVYDADGNEIDADVSESFLEIMRDFAQWIYDKLEADYDYRMSNEVVDDSIEANEYEFEEDGTFAG